jgi:hypothetical protein
MRIAQTPRSIERERELASERAALKSAQPENGAQREPCNPRTVGNLPFNTLVTECGGHRSLETVPSRRSQ